MDDMTRTCVICGGPMGKRHGDICCREEDGYLMIKCKGHMREFEGRECGIDEMVELLYDDLAEYLVQHEASIENYEQEGVLMELERRVLRWMNKKMIDFKTMKGFGFCATCGAVILAGRTKCSSCAGASQVQGMIKNVRSTGAPPPIKPHGGMYSKR